MRFAEANITLPSFLEIIDGVGLVLHPSMIQSSNVVFNLKVSNEAGKFGMLPVNLTFCGSEVPIAADSNLLTYTFLPLTANAIFTIPGPSFWMLSTSPVCPITDVTLVKSTKTPPQFSEQTVTLDTKIDQKEPLKWVTVNITQRAI